MTSAQLVQGVVQRMLQNEIARFLIAGTAAAGINWLSRIALSYAMPFWSAVLIAYVIGMVAGYILYSNFVFVGQRSARSGQSQIRDFILVNLISAAAVLMIAIGSANVLSVLLTREIAEAVAHLFAIGCGAVLNYILHKYLTFR